MANFFASQRGKPCKFPGFPEKLVKEARRWAAGGERPGDREEEFQPEGLPRLLELDLAAVALCGLAHAGDAEAVEEGISLGGALGGGGFWLGPVLHGDQEHVPNALPAG